MKKAIFILLLSIIFVPIVIASDYRVSWEGGVFQIPVIPRGTPSGGVPSWIICSISYWGPNNNYASVTFQVSKNKTQFSRSAQIFGANIYQEGCPVEHAVDWINNPGQFSIVGPEGLNGTGLVTYSLSGPGIDPKVADIQWSAMSYGSYGSGHVVSGQNTMSATFNITDNSCFCAIIHVKIRVKSTGQSIEKEFKIRPF